MKLLTNWEEIWMSIIDSKGYRCGARGTMCPKCPLNNKGCDEVNPKKLFKSALSRCKSVMIDEIMKD